MAEDCVVSDDGSEMIRSSYISGLNDELLVEILCRLGSSKYAAQCKSICKRWFSLIDTNPSGSYFLCRWRLIHHKKEVALLTQYCHKWGYEHHLFYHSNSSEELPTFKSLSFLPVRSVDIWATCKDLVLCCQDSNIMVYYVCNPFTKQWTALPPPPRRHDYSVAVALIVSEDPYAFIFQVVRVVALVSEHDNKFKLNVEIFSSDNGEWRQVILFDVGRRIEVHSRLVSYNGMIVWLNKGAGVFGLKINPRDANDDSYFHISLPVGFEPNKQESLIGVSRGCLRIAQLVHPPADENNIKYSLKLVIWELNSHSQTWERVLELDFSEVDNYSMNCSTHDLNIKLKVSLHGFHPHDGDLLYLQFVVPHIFREAYSKVNSHIYLCNTRKRTLELIGELPGWCFAFPLQLPCWPTQIPLLSNHNSYVPA